MKRTSDKRLMRMKTYIIMAVLIFIFNALDFNMGYHFSKIVDLVSTGIALILLFLGYREVNNQKIN